MHTFVTLFLTSLPGWNLATLPLVYLNSLLGQSSLFATLYLLTFHSSRYLPCSIQLTRVLKSRRREKNTEPGLKVGGSTSGVWPGILSFEPCFSHQGTCLSCVLPAEVDAVGQHECSRSWVQHILGGSKNLAGDQLKVDSVGGGGAEAGLR